MVWAAVVSLPTVLCAEPLAASAEVTDETVSAAVESAHETLWSKFIGTEGVIHDFVGELPTPDDCAQGRPNAIGWWSPIENGPMFTGTYLAAMCERARRSGAESDQDEARRLANGLLKCASVSDVPGFIARGVGTDGKCHYPMGSQDQTHPWFCGLHAYVNSGIPTADERQTVVAKMKEVAEALEKSEWKCPCDGAFRGQFRGDFQLFRNHGVVMYLFNLRAMYDVTGDEVWLKRYHAALTEQSPATGKTRLQICAEGIPHDRSQIKHVERLLWIYVGSQGGLAWLAEAETDEQIRSQYRAGLAVNARLAASVVDEYQTFDNSDTKVFGNARWREGYPAWFSQQTQKDAEKMAATGDREVLGQRKWYEASRMRNPLAAAALIAFAGDRQQFDAVRRAICHYDYAKLNMAEFFFAECAYYAMAIRQAAEKPQAKQETVKTMKTELIDYFGYTGCISLENATTRVVLCPQAGGRVLEYALNGANALYLNEQQRGWRYQPNAETVDPCGGRFDVGPERTITRHPDLWLGDWTGEIVGEGKARLTSSRDAATGLRLVREFTLAADSSRVTCEQRVTNESDKPITCCHWSRTLAVGGGICLIPLTRDSRFPQDYIMYGPGPVMNFQPDDPNIRRRDGFLEILGTPANPKLGMDSTAGWFAYLTRNNLMFVKRFPVDSDRVYAEMASLTISIWYFKNEMCELEPIGPREILSSGESFSYTENWELLPYDFPADAKAVDLESIRQLVGTK